MGAPTEIWSGTGGIWPEGPHLYKVDTTYFLMISEGGTDLGHRVTIARSDSPSGPFQANPQNPILTHEGTSEPIQATGHGDLVQAANGSWWMVFLGIRCWDGQHHHLGRETFLAPVEWDAGGWPVVNRGGPVLLRMNGEGLTEFTPWPAPPARTDFGTRELGLEWNHVRNPVSANYSLDARAGFLRLTATNITMDDIDAPTFVGRRQAHLRATLSTRLEFKPTHVGQEAGLVIRMNEDHHYDLLVTHAAGAPSVALKTRVGGITTMLNEAALAHGAVTLTIEAYQDRYEFFFATGDDAPIPLGQASTVDVSTQVAGGFTGVYVGLYAATRSGAPAFNADFQWLEYVAH
jgi:alpha-N-arabinofuranosidase